MAASNHLTIPPKGCPSSPLITYPLTPRLPLISPHDLPSHATAAPHPLLWPPLIISPHTHGCPLSPHNPPSGPPLMISPHTPWLSLIFSYGRSSCPLTISPHTPWLPLIPSQSPLRAAPHDLLSRPPLTLHGRPSSPHDPLPPGLPPHARPDASPAPRRCRERRVPSPPWLRAVPHVAAARAPQPENSPPGTFAPPSASRGKAAEEGREGEVPAGALPIGGRQASRKDPMMGGGARAAANSGRAAGEVSRLAALRPSAAPAGSG